MKKIEYVYLGASGWCTTCRTIKPIFEKEAQRLKELHKDNADISYVCYDIEDDEKGVELVEKYMVKSIPTMLVFIDEEFVGKVTGSAIVKKMEDYYGVRI